MLLTPSTQSLDALYNAKLDSIPKEIRDKLYVPEVTQAITGAMQAAGVSESRRPAVNLIALQIFTGDIPLHSIQKLLLKWGIVDDEKKAFKFTQSLTENFLMEHRDYLVKAFGESYFSPNPDTLPKKPNEYSPKIEGNIVNLKDA